MGVNLTTRQFLSSVANISIAKNAFFALSLFIVSFSIGIIDFVTGSDFTFSPGYLIPPAIAAWKSHRNWGVFFSFLNTAIWLSVDVSSSRYSPVIAVYIWNFSSRLIFLIVVVYLIKSFQTSLENEKILSSTDFLTKALNSRKFKEALVEEINRSLRYHHPLTLVYLDIDNFKAINDQYGHGVGDEVLSSLAQEILHSLRHTDKFGRMGGDEFAILLIETGPAAAETIVAKLNHNLRSFIEGKGWRISVSFGVLSCVDEFASAETLISIADELMYSVKKKTKNDAEFFIYGEQKFKDSVREKQ